MKRDTELFKLLLRQKADEVITHKVRKNGNLTTLRQFNLYYPAHPGRTLNYAYFRNKMLLSTGTISKSEIFVAMRKLAVKFK